MTFDNLYEKAYSDINVLWLKNLKKSGIKMPDKNTAAAAQLVYLYLNMGKIVAKDDIADFVQKYIKNAKKDQQVRHLGSQKGWNVLNKGQYTPDNRKIPSGYHCLVNLDEPLAGWVENNQRRNLNLNPNEFNKIKEIYDYCCATCGCKEGSRHRKFKNEIVELQKGHMDPSKPLDKGNIIPQCQICNRSYLDKWIFDENGYIHALNKPEIIKKSPLKTRKAVYLILKEEFEKD